MSAVGRGKFPPFPACANFETCSYCNRFERQIRRRCESAQQTPTFQEYGLHSPLRLQEVQVLLLLLQVRVLVLVLVRGAGGRR
jgi:hypothetical protein